MKNKILKTEYDNLMLAYYVNYKDNIGNTKTEYFDSNNERNAFIKRIK
jgi:hypothetical protein